MAFPAPSVPRHATNALTVLLALTLPGAGVSGPLRAQNAAIPANALAATCTGPAFTVLRREAPDALPTHARAIWLNARQLRWPQGPDSAAAPGDTGAAIATGRYVLYASAQATLRVVVGQTVAGATDTLRLHREAGPHAPTNARWRHIGAGVTVSVPARISRRRVAELLAQQLVLVHEDNSGQVLEATRTQAALALDDHYAAAAEPLAFGASAAAATTFRLWAPTAQRVTLCLFAADTARARAVPLVPDARSGVWHARVAGATHGTAYRYLVDVVVPGVGVVRNRVTDPWSLALTANSSHSVVADLGNPSLIPIGWPQRRAPRLTHPVDQVIYELHVRDFSVRDAQVPVPHRGRYLAFTDSAGNGMRHLRALAAAGLTDVHLLPVFDLATVPEIGCTTPVVQGTPDGDAQQAIVGAAAASDCFNWGYDPLHFTVPEGSYATNVADFGARIREFRRMVMALNAAGLRVGMDVVYNHTSASGQSPQSVLDRIVPGYYHRLDANGRVETSTCCANTATEHRIMAKLMIESTVTWVTHYGISSFRFDLMGHQPRAVMERLQRAVNAAAGTTVPLIGEGWNFGEVADGRRFVQASQLSLPGSGIATFSDRARDAVRGGSALDDGIDQLRNQGWVNGLGYAPNDERRRMPPTADDGHALARAADMVRLGMAGSLREVTMLTADGSTRRLADLTYGGQPAGYVQEPREVVNYVENHDNQTLFDANVLKLSPGTSTEDRARVQLLASAVVLFSQGIAYVHAGQELLRSKSLDRNSFDSGDWFNPYDPTGETHGFARGLPPRKDNEASWSFMRARLADSTLVPPPPLVRFTRNAFLDLLRIRTSSGLFRLRTAAEVQQRLHFLAAGPSQQATVVAVHLDGALAAGGVVPGARFRDVVVVINAGVEGTMVPMPSLAGRALHLHPVHLATSAADTRARESHWNRGTGEMWVPARTAVVWVRE
ncbi:hypothetical protein MASR1M101_40840 [Gemmatimonas sp.]